MANHFVIIAGEEAGSNSNKMDGIWNVIDENHQILQLLKIAVNWKQKMKLKFLLQVLTTDTEGQTEIEG